MLGLWGVLNWVKFGNPLLTGYHLWKPEQHGLNGSLFDSLPQLLFSVQWGFVFVFPILGIAIPWIWRWVWMQPIAYGTILAIGIVYVVLLGLLPSWTGAWCYGPRYRLFILPYVALPAISALEWLRSRTPAAVLTAVMIVCGLGYSTWLQFQVNRFPFFAYYYLGGAVSKSTESSSAEFFANHSYGWIEYTMWRHRENLDSLPWWQATKAAIPAAAATKFEERVRRVLGRSNFYFFPANTE